MPKPRRESTARADTRPSFARPPGARAAPVEDDIPRTPKRTPKEKAKQSPALSPEKIVRGSGQKRKISTPVRPVSGTGRDRVKYNSGTSTGSSSQLLSADSLAKLNASNTKARSAEKQQDKKRTGKQYKGLKGPDVAQQRQKKKNRNVSGAILEEGRGNEKYGHVRRRGGGGHEKEYVRNRKTTRTSAGRKWWCIIGISVLALIVIIAIAVVVASKEKSSGNGSATTSDTSSGPANSCDASSTPQSAKGTYTDISTWMDTTDFNCTFTAETVGNLSVMGLHSTWDDSTQANSNVPPLNQQWKYGQTPIRGVNLGGWLSLEPFITPSLFQYPADENVVDEWTLSQKLSTSLQRGLETHYSTFVTKQTFLDIANAGLDHVRIPYPYWAVTTYDGDPYLPQVAWRYLLRAIEWARESGIRVNLDLHSVPGSQNGWAHSGHQGSIDWISGPDGATNAQRSLDIHNQLSQFFAQDRYTNVVTIYGLVNEPKMLVIPPASVTDWNTQAIAIIRKNGIKQYLTFGDGFLSLDSWDNMFKGVDTKLVLDTHQYQIFNVGELKLTHQDKISLVCTGWKGLLVAANNPSSGWGPTLDGEWSQADTDCTPNLNNVGAGSRWAGSLNTTDISVLTPSCASPPCSCAQANADGSQYSASYKQFLKMYAEAQMYSFEQAWGWFYWTWKTENAVQWSWQLGLEAGILPAKAYAPDFRCDSDVPSFSDLSESY